jgi:predicted outer membrane protein
MALPRTALLAAAAFMLVAAAGCERKGGYDTREEDRPRIVDEAPAPPPADATMPAADATVGATPDMNAATAAGVEPPIATPATTDLPAATTSMVPAIAVVLNAADKAFLASVTKANNAEIATSELGMARGNAKSKALSRMLNADHVALRDQVAAMQPDAPVQPAATAPTGLSGMRDTAFDNRLLAVYVEQHDAAIRAFSEASRNTALTEPVRQLATDTLPKLRQHLAEVKDARRAE